MEVKDEVLLLSFDSIEVTTQIEEIVLPAPIRRHYEAPRADWRFIILNPGNPSIHFGFYETKITLTKLGVGFYPGLIWS